MTRVLATDATETLTAPIVLGPGDGGITGANRASRLIWNGPGYAIECGYGFIGALRGFKLDLAPGAKGIKIGREDGGSAQVYVEDVHVAGGDVGWDLWGAQLCTFINAWSSSSDIGWYWRAASGNFASHVIGGQTTGNRVGVKVEHAIGCSYDRMAIQHNREEGVLVDPPVGGVREFRLERCHVERNNDGRTGTGHGQIRVENRNNSRSDVRIRGGTYNQPGTGNFHCVVASGALVDATDYWNGGGDFYPFDQSPSIMAVGGVS